MQGSQTVEFSLPPCQRCGRYHLGECRLGTNTCFWCGTAGHIMRECPKRGVSGIARPTGSTVASSASVPSSGGGVQPIGRGRDLRGAASSGGLQNGTYALADRQNEKAPLNEGIGILSHFSHDVHVVIDSTFTLSYVTLSTTIDYYKFNSTLGL